MDDFKDQVVVVTGAAGSLGQTVVKAFFEAGADLALVDRATDRLQRMYGDLLGSRPHLLIDETDLTDPAQVEAAADEIERKLKTVHVLLNIAGTFRGGVPVAEMDPGLWDLMLDVNAKSAFLMSRSLAPVIVKSGGGAIVNVAARPGLRAGRGNSAYAASKSAVLRLTESLSSELKGDGVNVNAIIPGTIDTAGNRESMPGSDPARWVSTQDVAEVILFLASDRASAIHGVAIPVLGLS